MMEQSKGLVLSSSTKMLDAVTLWLCSIREETRTGGAVLVTFRPPYMFPKRVSTNASFIYAHCYVPLHGISELQLLITAVSTSAITTRLSHRNPEEWVSVLPFSLMRPYTWCLLWWLSDAAVQQYCSSLSWGHGVRTKTFLPNDRKVRKRYARTTTTAITHSNTKHQNYTKREARFSL